MKLLVAVVAALAFAAPSSLLAGDDPPPEYLQTAKSLVEKANLRSAALRQFSDDALLALNHLRNAETEYNKNLSWGRLKPEAEPAVRYLAGMAGIQASIVLSRASRTDIEKERVSLEKRAVEKRSHIKVFEDKVAEITVLKAKTENLEKQLSERDSRIVLLSAAEARGIEAQKALEAQKKATAAAEQRAASLSAEVETGKQRIARLESEIAALAAQKGAEERKVSALSRQNAFEAAVTGLGGVYRPGADAVSATIPRSRIFKVSSKSTALTPDGDTLAQKIAAVVASYPEYRVKIRVHGFGSPVKNEDPVATDIMARILRDAVVTAGKLDPAAVEALGVGTAEPAYPKGNPEGNRRAEIVFVRK